MANEFPEATARPNVANKHEFIPQRDPFGNLCSECGMGRVAVCHHGPRYQFVTLPHENKIVDRDSEHWMGVTASTKDAQIITEALNSYDALREAIAAALDVLEPSEDPQGRTAQVINQLRAALHPQPEEGK